MKKIQQTYCVLTLILTAFFVLTLTACQPSQPNGNNGGGKGDEFPATYTVIFDANDGIFSNGSEKQTIQVESGSKLFAPSNPTRDNYTFVGWSRSKSGTDTWQFDLDTVTQNITLYAQWTQSGPKEYQLSVSASDPNAGTVEGGGSYTSGSTVTISAKTNLGYKFVGWYKDGAQVSSSLQYGITVPNEDTAYTAKFELLEEMKNFVFESTPTDCLITNVVDSSITEIIIPDLVTLIAVGSLQQCTNLQSITLPFVGSRATGAGYTNFGSIFGAPIFAEQNVYIPSSLKSVVITGGKRIDSSAFYGCSNLTSIKIPKSVTSIGDLAFSDCSNLKTVMFEDGIQLRSIGNNAFYECRSLTSITIPRGVTSIGDKAFYGCSSLSRIFIPSSVTSVGRSAFKGCTILYIYCEAATRPSGWDSTWSAGCPVTWNYNSNG